MASAIAMKIQPSKGNQVSRRNGRGANGTRNDAMIITWKTTDSVLPSATTIDSFFVSPFDTFRWNGHTTLAGYEIDAIEPGRVVIEC